jgi:VanZ family protein
MHSGNFHPIWRKILPWLLVVLFALFFVGGPNIHSSRHFKAFWNLGHILFFALVPYLLFSYRKWLAGRFSAQALIVLGICLVLGVLIELVQYDFKRTPDVGDVFRDVIGCLVGIFFFELAEIFACKGINRLSGYYHRFGGVADLPGLDRPGR